jgi:hypothetical protein
MYIVSLPNPFPTEALLKILQFLIWHIIAELRLWLFYFIAVSNVIYSDNIFAAPKYR